MSMFRRSVHGLSFVMIVLVAVLHPGLAMAHQYGGERYTNNHSGDDFYYPGSTSYNGNKIYLSPAHHWDGWNYGCGSYIEDRDMREIANRAAEALKDRGFYARVGAGDPDDAVRRSNDWNSRRHVSLHSNAGDYGQCGNPHGGTRTFHHPQSSAGPDLAGHLFRELGPESPGGLRDANQPYYLVAWELEETTMPAAYVETAYHDFSPDQNWLDQKEDRIGRLIALAIDKHLGYPPICSPCPTSIEE